jgi:acetyl esterase/lipase
MLERSNMTFQSTLCSVLSCGAVLAATCFAETAPDASLPEPTRYTATINLPYGPGLRQKLDFYQAPSDKPTPVLLLIPGGDWNNGDKREMASYFQGRPGQLRTYIDAGISVVAFNYTYIWQTQLAGVKPPVKTSLEDAARALQFVRSKAGEWNIDKDRICAYGESAGGCTSLWLAFHDDLADPKSADPVARESTRLWCAAVSKAQTSLDPKQMTEWTPNNKYGGYAFGFMDPKDVRTRDARYADFLAQREELLPWIKEYSPYELVTKNDPPVYLSYATPPALGQEEKDPLRTANFGVKLQERCKEAGVECELVYPGAPDVKHPKIEDYIIETLKAPPAGSKKTN